MTYFTRHLEEINESYFEHMRHAVRFSTKLAVGSMACFIHAVFPFLCKKTGSSIISELHHDMVSHRARPGGRKGFGDQLVDTA